MLHDNSRSTLSRAACFGYTALARIDLPPFETPVVAGVSSFRFSCFTPWLSCLTGRIALADTLLDPPLDLILQPADAVPTQPDLLRKIAGFHQAVDSAAPEPRALTDLCEP